jgi:hypothetical protein
MSEWTFLTNHAHVLLCVARDPGVRLREVADAVGITERAAQRIVTDLVEAGYLERHREGRRNRYEVHPRLPMRHPLEQQHAVGEVLAVLTGPGTLAPAGGRASRAGGTPGPDLPARAVAPAGRGTGHGCEGTWRPWDTRGVLDRRTKILATLGPSTDGPGVIDELIACGMDCARLNASHGTHEDLRRRATAVREAATRAGARSGCCSTSRARSCGWRATRCRCAWPRATS